MNVESLQFAKKLFLEASELDGASRDAFVEMRCGDEPELRDYVLRLLVRAGDSDEPQPAALRQQPEANAATPELENFTMLEELGRGSMGVVWLAEQKSLRRRVALKLLRPGFIDASMQKRFEHEAAILGRLQHPGIAQIYEVGCGDEQPFFAMEFVPGEPLTVSADNQRLGLDARLELVASIADAVAHAHAHGVIHRDLKPDNILVTADGKPKILDFGIARATDSDVMTMTMHTVAGQVLGTVPYMSPEQVLGDPTAIDVRSDVYSLGVILYELLSGRLPVDVTGHSIPEAARMIRDDEPTRLSTITTACRGDVETIVEKAIEKDKTRRYQSAAEFAADLRRFLRSEPIVARPTTTLYRAKKFVRRHKGLTAGLVATFAVLLVGAIVSASLALRATRNAERSERNAYAARLMAAAAALERHDIASARSALDATAPELRGWEWRHLHSRLDTSLMVLELPPTDVENASPCPPDFSHDGRVVSAWLLGSRGEAAPCVLAQWDTSTGSRLADAFVLDAPIWHTQRARASSICLALSEDRVFVLDTREGGSRHFPRSALAGAGDFNTNHILSDDGRTMSWYRGEGWHDGATFLAPLEDVPRRGAVRIAAHAGAMAISPDGSRVAIKSSARRGGLALWQSPSGWQSLVGHENELLMASFSYDGAVLVTGSADRTIRTWDVDSGAALACSPLLDGRLLTLAIRRDGKRVACSTDDGVVRILDTATLEIRAVLHGHRPGDRFRPIQMEFSRDGKLLASKPQGGRELRVWDATVDGDATVLRAHESYVYGVAFRRDGRQIASCAWDHTVRLWDARTLEPIRALHSGKEGPYGEILYQVAYSPDGHSVVATGYHANAFVWDTRTGGQPVEIDYGLSPGTPLTFHPEGTRLLVGVRPPSTKDAGAIRVYDCVERTERELPFATLAEFKSGAVSPDGSRYVSTEGDGPWRKSLYWLVMRDTRTGQELLRFQIGEHTDGKFAFRPLGTGPLQLLVPHRASPDVPRSGWSLFDADGKRIVERSGIGALPIAAQFSPDGARIVTGGPSRVIRVWDTVHFDELVRLRGHESYVYRLAFSPDGSKLASASGDGTLRVWDTQALRHVLQARRDGR